MTSLARRLAALETIVSSEDATGSRRAVRFQRWCDWAAGLLGTMQPDRAQRVHAEMVEQPRELWGPVARRVDAMAAYGASGAFDTAGWPYWADRAIALPEAVCEALEAYPDASYTTDFSCPGCGLEIPHRNGVRAPLLTTCPLCDGSVGWAAFNQRRYRDASRRVMAG